MSLASSRVSLIHRCTIERATVTQDAYGGESLSWATHLSDLPCRAWETTGHESVDPNRTAVTLERFLMVALGTDVTESDRVASVTKSGASIFEGPMSIQTVRRTPDHLEIALGRTR